MSHRARRPPPRPARPQAAPVDLVQAVVEAIARGELDDELAVLGAVINERVRLLATARSMRTLASLRVGDRVRINHNAKPRLPARPGRDGELVGRTERRRPARPADRPLRRRRAALPTARPRATGT
jgi:hypothetical protein